MDLGPLAHLEMDFAVKMFQQEDTNNTGQLTAEQVRNVLAKMGTKFSMAEVQMLVSAYDDNKNKLMELAEFKQLCYALQKLDSVNMEAFMFYVADTNMNGIIDQQEFLQIMKRLNVKLPEEKLIAMAKKLGGDKVEINFEKFSALMAQIKKLFE